MKRQLKRERQFRVWFVAVVALCFLSLSNCRVDAQSHLVRLPLPDTSTGVVTDVVTGVVSRVSVASLSDERFITAVTNESGNLKLKVWDVTANAQFTPRGDYEGGLTTVFALTAIGFASPGSAAPGSAALGSSGVVIAVQQADGNLRLIYFVVGKQGDISRRGMIDGGEAARIAIAAAGPARVVTATQNIAGETKLIVWDVDQSGQFVRKRDHAALSGTQVALAALSATQLVCAVRGTNTKLDVSAWRLSADAAGTLSPLGSAPGPEITELAITNTATDRAVTAVRLTDGFIEIEAWDVDANDKVIAGRPAKTTALGEHVALTALGSAKVVTAIRQPDETLKLTSWQVIDNVRQLDEIAAGPVGLVSVTALGWDHMITAVQEGGDKLKLIDWADFSVSLLHRQWPPQKATGHPCHDNDPTKWPVPSPSQALFFPHIEGVDPMIAAGERFLIVSEDHCLEFLDKKGNQLRSKAGEPTLMLSNDFFSTFLARNNDDGTVNRNNIDLHLRFPPDSSVGLYCDLHKDVPCIDEFYDTRIAFDEVGKRFLVLAEARGKTGFSDPATDAVTRRYYAFAISKSEDPRDGFDQYMTTESNVTDWPRMALNPMTTTADAGVLVVAHSGCKDDDTTDQCDRPFDKTRVTDNFIALRPMAYIYLLSDLRNGEPAPQNWKIFPFQTSGGTLVPVIHHGDTKGWTFLVKEGTPLEVFGFPRFKWDQSLPLTQASGNIKVSTQGFTEGITFRSGKLFFAGSKQAAKRAPNSTPERFTVLGIQIPIKTTSSAIDFVSCNPKSGPNPDCLNDDFGPPASDDLKNELWSNEMESLAVNDKGTMFMVFGRVAAQPKPSKAQEVRFSLHFDDSRGLDATKLLKKGTVLLKTVDCKNGENTLVAENYVHIVKSVPKSSVPSGECFNETDHLDFVNAVRDPDGNSFWFAHSFPTHLLADNPAKDTFELVIGQVVPPPAPPPVPKKPTKVPIVPCRCPGGGGGGDESHPGEQCNKHICPQRN